jgi:hypothetical protein
LAGAGFELGDELFNDFVSGFYGVFDVNHLFTEIGFM